MDGDKKQYWSKLTKLQKRLVIVASIITSIGVLAPGVIWVVKQLLHEQITEYKSIKSKADRSLELHYKLEEKFDNKVNEFTEWADDFEQRLRAEQQFHKTTRQVGLRADTNCVMYYQDKCGNSYKVYPDLQLSTDQWTYWYYIDKTHRKRYVFNERYD